MAARRSTCSRASVGALIVANNDVVSIGYNGPPPGDEHCKGNACERSATGGCLRSVHAEENAIDRAQRKIGADLYGCDIYVTFAPCRACAETIIGSCISRVFYRHPYRIRDGIELLKSKVCIALYRVTPAGIIIEERSGDIISPEGLYR